MTKNEIIAVVAEKAGVSKKDTAKIVDAFFDTITVELANGNPVRFTGFGSFETRVRAARQGKNPRTGEILDIPEAKIPAFKAGRGLKEAVNK